MKKPLAVLAVLAMATDGLAQATTADPSVRRKKSWTESFAIRGYIQTRYNRLLETNPDLQCEQCDRSWGGTGGFFLRRARMVISGDVHARVYVYFQHDFASAVGNSLNAGQVRDAYVDVAADTAQEFRFRIGQSKLPYGFENMQSSSNRIPLDRADATNSAATNERDLGLMFYYAPKRIRDRFSKLTSEGLKGSGDYGVVGLGVFNGQGANQLDRNRLLHVVGRVAYPFQLRRQIIEPGVQAYSGRYVVANRSTGMRGTTDFEYWDQRVAGTFVVYPQPLGLFAEWNVGRGPEYNPRTDSIELRRLHGGYIMLVFRKKIGEMELLPFVRGQYYEGGKKFELDARRYRMRELEIGIEWQMNRNFELVTQYTISRRRFEDHTRPNNLQSGSLLRLQAQINY